MNLPRAFCRQSAFNLQTILLFWFFTAHVAAQDDPDKQKSYSQGTHEVGAAFALTGNLHLAALGISGTYSYFLHNGLALGLEVKLSRFILDKEYGYEPPNAVTVLPFLKIALIRSRAIAPFLIVTGGSQFEWASAQAVRAGAIGGGAGVWVGINDRIAIDVRVLALAYFYNTNRVYGYSDEQIYYDGTLKYLCQDGETCDFSAWTPANQNNPGFFEECDDIREDGILGNDCRYPKYYCPPGQEMNDQNCRAPLSDGFDKKKEMIFPLVTLGITFFF